jgi:RNA polymerase sigma-70 factor, ECF subfamily
LNAAAANIVMIGLAGEKPATSARVACERHGGYLRLRCSTCPFSHGKHPVVLLNADRDLLDRCLQKSPDAWEAFVDRFAGLVAHVVEYTALSRSLVLDKASRDDLIAEVFLVLIQNDYAVLKRFRGNSSLATYLTVIARRIAVRQLRKNRSLKTQTISSKDSGLFVARIDDASQLEDRQHIESALATLSQAEATAVRMFHIEGRSYREISDQIGLAENSIGPFLTRAREKLRKK